jgi:hypothetical protein
MKNYYFAYGSNICQTQMTSRCPEHEIVSTVILPDYELCFPRFSRGDRQCGVASIVEKLNSNVWGVLYKLSNSDFEKLDIHENIPHSYIKTKLTVRSLDLINSFEAITYLANHQVGEFYPSEVYLNLILNGLKLRLDVPVHYVDELSKVKRM